MPTSPRPATPCVCSIAVGNTAGSSWRNLIRASADITAEEVTGLQYADGRQPALRPLRHCSSRALRAAWLDVVRDSANRLRHRANQRTLMVEDRDIWLGDITAREIGRMLESIERCTERPGEIVTRAGDTAGVSRQLRDDEAVPAAAARRLATAAALRRRSGRPQNRRRRQHRQRRRHHLLPLRPHRHRGAGERHHGISWRSGGSHRPSGEDGR